MKGIDYLTEINQHLPCIVTFRHPHPKKLVFALSGTRTHVSLITSRAC